jgi:hypothetical protein
LQIWCNLIVQSGKFEHEHQTMVHVICYYVPNPRPPNLWHFEYPGEVSNNSSFMEVKQKIYEQGGPSPDDQRFLMHCDVKFRNVYTGGREKQTVQAGFER